MANWTEKQKSDVWNKLPVISADPSGLWKKDSCGALIRRGNSAVLFVSEEEYGGGHAVIATGYHYYNGGGGIYVHNDLVHGETWITTTYVIAFGAILELDR